ncbi:MAG: sulfatase [Akkermansiaceae bacterium]|nr:sulfatase [Akkermansiaceae bacterium]
MKRRRFLATTGGALAAAPHASRSREATSAAHPNILYLFSDQWRSTDHGYAGNTEVRTPHIDGLAREAVNFSNAVSGIPVCCPHRACLLTGQYPLTHGLFLNDLRLNTNAPSFAHALASAGYDTGYIGKWHLDGTGRSAYIPPERRQGFDYWKVLECTHNYNKSQYYDKTGTEPKVWDGYDAYAQTRDAVRYIQSRARPSGEDGAADEGKPWSLFLSWGPPHAPYRTGPKKWLDRYDKENLTLRKNVPPGKAKVAQETYAGYYAHCSALDECVGWLMDALRESGQLEHTIIVYTSDHGDMLWSRGQLKKQRPWDESLRVPFLVRCPESMKVTPKTIAAPINTPDIMPTVLSLAGAGVPDSVEGEDFSPVIRGEKTMDDNHALITCPAPFGQWQRKDGGREYRGIRTNRYTYTRALDGPWELFDNQADPFQQENLLGKPGRKALHDELEDKLRERLAQTGDDFAPAAELIKRGGYRVDAGGTVGYRDEKSLGQVSKPCRG